jgi:hypothetical protein
MYYNLHVYQTDGEGSFHKNTFLSEFKPTNIKCVYSVTLDKTVLKLDYKLCMLQVYPSQEEKSFYSIPKGKQLYVYCMDDKVYVLKCSTFQNDNYLYFKPTDKTTAIYIVEATTATEALDLLLLLLE